MNRSSYNICNTEFIEHIKKPVKEASEPQEVETIIKLSEVLSSYAFKDGMMCR